MSRHYFEATTTKGQSVLVSAGWDNPLSQYFLDVEVDATDSEKEKMKDEGVIYTSMCDASIVEKDEWDYFKAKFTELGIELPEGFSDHLMEDQVNRVGNFVKEWK